MRRARRLKDSSCAASQAAKGVPILPMRSCAWGVLSGTVQTRLSIKCSPCKMAFQTGQGAETVSLQALLVKASIRSSSSGLWLRWDPNVA